MCYFEYRNQISNVIFQQFAYLLSKQKDFYKFTGCCLEETILQNRVQIVDQYKALVHFKGKICFITYNPNKKLHQ